MKFIADCHTHSIACAHAYSTVTEIAQAAAQAGLACVALTDHGPAMDDSPHLYHFLNLRVLPKEICGVRVLRGIEANILNAAGELDLENRWLEQMEMVIASVHDITIQDTAYDTLTAAWTAVANNPRVMVAGHPGRGGEALRFDYETVIPLLGKNGKAVEINEHTFKISKAESADNCRQILTLCAKHGVPVIINSDAHYHAAIGRFDNVPRLLKELDFPENLILNTDITRLSAFLGHYGIHV